MKSVILLFSLIFLGRTFAQTATKRALKPSDVYLLQNLSDPRVSPDGN